jgi:hypothetical protein
VTCAFENVGIFFEKIQPYNHLRKRNFTLEIITIQYIKYKCSKTKIQSALKSTFKKPELMELTFGLCGVRGDIPLVMSQQVQ